MQPYPSEGGGMSWRRQGDRDLKPKLCRSIRKREVGRNAASDNQGLQGLRGSQSDGGRDRGHR
jgi:hypothetical protein